MWNSKSTITYDIKCPSYQALLKRKTHRKWLAFLREPIYITETGTTTLPRYVAVENLVHDALFPWLQQRGYTWNVPAKAFTQVFLQILFHMYQGSAVRIPNLQREFSPHYYEYFTDKVDTVAWDRFWRTWGPYDDFCEGYYGYRARFLLPDLVWNYIDIQRSVVLESIHMDVMEREGYEISKGKDDPYLQDIQQGLLPRDKHTY